MNSTIFTQFCLLELRETKQILLRFKLKKLIEELQNYSRSIKRGDSENISG